MQMSSFLTLSQEKAIASSVALTASDLASFISVSESMDVSVSKSRIESYVSRMSDKYSGGDYKAIAKAPGVGTKTAQRVILELKDKVADGLPVTSDIPGVTGGANASQVIDTLTLYGFSREQIKDAMRSVSSALPLEEMIAETLRILASKR